MGNTCKPMAVSFQCMTKSTTIKKNKKNEYGWYISDIFGGKFKQTHEEMEFADKLVNILKFFGIELECQQDHKN